MSPSIVVVRLDRRLRTLLVVYFTCCGAFVLVGAVVVAFKSPAIALVPVTMLLVVAAVGWRWTGVEVRAMDSGVIVRNLLTTRRLLRKSIRGFRSGGGTLEFPGYAVRAVLEDGSTVVLTATGFRGGNKTAVDEIVAQLEGWLSSNGLHD